MARSGAQPLLFRGAGRSLSAALPAGFAVTGDPPWLDLDAPDADRARAEFVMLRGEAGLGLRVRLPRGTPAGTYKGTVRLGKAKRSVVVEVPANASLRLRPDEIALPVAPGGEVRASVVATNSGNVEIDLPRSPLLRFFASPGLDRDPGRLYEVRVPGFDPIYARTDELELCKAGVAHVVLRKGAGALRPGDERTIELAVRVDRAATPGLRYFGVWDLAGETFGLRLDVDQSRPTAEEVT